MREERAAFLPFLVPPVVASPCRFRLAALFGPARHVRPELPWRDLLGTSGSIVLACPENPFEGAICSAEAAMDTVGTIAESAIQLMFGPE